MYSTFETEISVRPDDIDLNNHLHSSKYIDYVLYARFEQMKNNYKMSMKEFHERGLNWVTSSIHIDFKREIKLDDKVIVRTRLEDFNGAQSKVSFSIINKETQKIAAEGYFLYTMISLTSGRPVRIPDDIIEKYTI